VSPHGVEPSSQASSHVCRGVDSLGHILLETLAHKKFQVGREAGAQVTHQCRFIPHDCVEDFIAPLFRIGGLADEWLLASEEFIKDNSERPDVGASIDRGRRHPGPKCGDLFG
jgi:hypothetical protein